MLDLRRVLKLFLVTILVLTGACISAPVQEMSNARQAIAAAEEAGAAKSAPERLAEAQRLLQQAEIGLQDRHYRAARRAAIEAQATALTALEATGADTGTD